MKKYSVSIEIGYGNKITLQRISKAKAKKFYDQNKSIYVYACNIFPGGYMSFPVEFSKKRLGQEVAFVEINSCFINHYCNSRLGRYPAYYINEKEVKNT